MRQGLLQETCSVRVWAEMLFGPNAPQVGSVDGLNLFEVGIAFAREFWGMGWHPCSGAAYRTDATTAQSRGGEAIGQNSGLCRSNSNTVAKDSSEAL